MPALMILFLIFAMIFFIALFNTFVLSMMWGWYITPIFKLPVPDLYLLYGLMLILGFVTTSPEKEPKSFGKAIVDVISKGSMFLLIGWFVQAVFS